MSHYTHVWEYVICTMKHFYATMQSMKQKAILVVGVLVLLSGCGGGGSSGDSGGGTLVPVPPNGAVSSASFPAILKGPVKGHAAENNGKHDVSADGASLCFPLDTCQPPKIPVSPDVVSSTPTSSCPSSRSELLRAQPYITHHCLSNFVEHTDRPSHCYPVANCDFSIAYPRPPGFVEKLYIPKLPDMGEIDESYCVFVRGKQAEWHCDPSVHIGDELWCTPDYSLFPCTPTLPTEPTPRISAPTPGVLELADTLGGRKYIFENHSAYTPLVGKERSTQLSIINAADAYAGGWTGHGQVIAVVDTGFHTEHLSLNGDAKTVRRYSPRTKKGVPSVVETDDPETNKDERRNDFEHGTAVAAVAAGNRGKGSMHGVAFDARFYYHEFTNALIHSYHGHEFWSQAINRPRDGRVSAADRAFIVNFSFGSRETIAGYLDPTWKWHNRVSFRRNLRYHAPVLAQSHMYLPDRRVGGGGLIPINRADADKSILVFAAGDNHGKKIPTWYNNAVSHLPTFYASLPLLFPELGLEKNVLAVVAVDNDGVIASYSNRCGIAKDFCIAAPGNLLTADYSFNTDEDLRLQDDHYSKKNGTSLAAPTVSGALAVLRQRFGSQMGNTELVARLKATANNTGIYADSDIYGVGLLDLGAAVNDPVGEMQMSGISLNANSFTPGFSFGDALQTAFSGQLVTGFDELLTPFEYHLGGFVKNQNPSSLNPLRAFHQDWHRQLGAENGVSNGFGAAGFALDSAPEGSSHRISANPNSHLTLAQGGVNFALKPRNGIAFSLFNTTKKDGTPTAAGLSFAWQKTANFGVGGGVLRENEMALQSRGEGVFGGLNANTFFFGIAAKKEIRNWQFHAGAEAGAVFVDGDHWLDDVSTLITSSLSADAVKKLGDRNTLRLGISSPLRVEHGDANLTIPAGRTRYRELLHRKITPSLVPTGRQIDLTATWSRKLAFPNARIYASLRSSLEPGHRKTADSELSTLLSLELDF